MFLLVLATKYLYLWQGLNKKITRQARDMLHFPTDHGHHHSFGCLISRQLAQCGLDISIERRHLIGTVSENGYVFIALSIYGTLWAFVTFANTVIATGDDRRLLRSLLL